jgi:hypothetical protein
MKMCYRPIKFLIFLLVSGISIGCASSAEKPKFVPDPNLDQHCVKDDDCVIIKMECKLFKAANRSVIQNSKDFEKRDGIYWGSSEEVFPGGPACIENQLVPLTLPKGSTPRCENKICKVNHK